MTDSETSPTPPNRDGPNPIAPDALFVLVGPTAVGKKEIGLEIARRIDAEVIFMDSIKVYRGLSIGAAQPSAERLKGLRTHLLSICDPRAPFSVGKYLAAATEAVAAIRSRGKIPFFIGGTPLYLQGLLRGYFPGPEGVPAYREQLVSDAALIGVEGLHDRLRGIDPAAAERILPRDMKRITRALEVHHLTGKRLSDLQREETRRPIEGDFRVVGLTCDPTMLKARQRERVIRMLEKGLVSEVEALRGAGSLVGEAALAIGYREIVEYLDGGRTLEEAREAIITGTHQLHRKQRKWFRRFDEISWVERKPDDGIERLCAVVLDKFLREGEAVVGPEGGEIPPSAE